MIEVLATVALVMASVALILIAVAFLGLRAEAGRIRVAFEQIQSEAGQIRVALNSLLDHLSGLYFVLAEQERNLGQALQYLYGVDFPSRALARQRERGKTEGELGE